MEWAGVQEIEDSGGARDFANLPVAARSRAENGNRAVWAGFGRRELEPSAAPSQGAPRGPWPGPR